MTSRRIIVLIAIAAAVYLASAAILGARAVASIQDDDICWSPDVEFPTTCEDEDDD
ncbi:MAG: hypothetical protein ACT4OU_06765 [Hyphomicrobium sp.]